MHNVNIWEKLINSIINVSVVLIIFLPFYIFLGISILNKKLIFIFLFLLYKIGIILLNKNRSLGMLVTKTYWKKNYSLYHQFIHALLYTASFSTLLFWIIFPFDLFLVNMFFLQLPMMLKTNMTLHEYLAGKMEAIKN